MFMKAKGKAILIAVSVIIILSMVFVFSAPVFASDDENLINEVTAVRPANNVDSSATGFIDRGVDMSAVNDYTYAQGRTGKLRGALPTAFDWRTANPNMVTPIRNQGYYGDCWAYASTASVTGSLVRNGITSSALMLSPRQLAFAVYNKDTFAPDYSDPSEGTPLSGGGDYFMATAAMGKWFGPTTETFAPEPNPSSYDNPGTGLNQWAMPATFYKANSYHLSDMMIFPQSYNSVGSTMSNNIATIKSALVAYGPLATSYFAGNAGDPDDPTDYGDYGPNYAYYTTGSNATKAADHGVTVIGWDDNYSNLNFNSPPPGNGAWLIQNSWGASWGNGGTFWMSYYERTMGANFYMSANVKTNYSNIDYYDDLGWTGSGIGVPSSALYAANVFKNTNSATGKELSAVSFYTDTPGESYSISVYADPKPGKPNSGKQIKIGSGSSKTVSGTATYAGYHTVPLSTKYRFVAEDTYSVIVKIWNANGSYVNTIPVEMMDTSKDHLTIAKGQSYLSSNGKSWTDLKSLYQSKRWNDMGNASVKALYNTYSKTYLKGWYKKSNGTKKYFVKGVAVTGFKKIKGSKYYFNSTGTMMKGWQKIKGKKYYFKTNGKMVTGKYKIKGKIYYFSSKGVLKK